MKTSKFLSSYPVFIMWEQLNLNGFFENESLDIMWELSCSHYEDFLITPYNSDEKSEYDCINEYVKNLIKFYTN